MAKVFHGVQQEHTLVLLQLYASLFQLGQGFLQTLEIVLIKIDRLVTLSAAVCSVSDDVEPLRLFPCLDSVGDIASVLVLVAVWG